MSRSLAVVLLCIVLAMMLEAWAAYERGFEAGINAATRDHEPMAVAVDPADSVLVIINRAASLPDTFNVPYWRIHVRKR